MKRPFQSSWPAICTSRFMRGKIGKIVLIADPDTLGELRPLLHKEVQDAIVSELAKTLTNHSVDHIERSLRSA